MDASKEEHAVPQDAAESEPEVGLVQIDPWLAPYRDVIRGRIQRYQAFLKQLEGAGGLLGPFTQAYRYLGFTRGESHGQEGIWYREWAPGALSLRLIGDFNHWNRDAHPMSPDWSGVWSIFLPDALYGDRLASGSRVKVHVISRNGERMDRLPAFSRYVVQDGSGFVTQLYLPSPFSFRHPSPKLGEGEGLRIYETHVGMAQEEHKVGTFDEFVANVLPRVVDLGYNAIQLMAVMEHPYYASFGYHVANFYAVSSRFGTPESLKRLVDTAHGMGLLVLLDIVHSHAVKNTQEGLNRFDGTDHQYFHAGARGDHAAWDSKVFNYGKYEVLQFLLSNVRFWLEEFRFDGFRFDGVTSMLYHDHGISIPFTSYEDYFGPRVDEEAVLYLQLANTVTHTVNPNAVTIAEDVSGMAGLARPVEEGGIGFDYRLAMGVPDYWIKLLKEKRDEEWDLHELFRCLLDRRWSEKHVGYVESHDQAMVGDKTVAFRLMDQHMYWEMSRDKESLVIDRGVALHKLIRLVTFALAGEAYLNFMGNEFGHPEWIDFPREGNNNSFQYARRQWSLVDNPNLRYHDLHAFDRAMLRLDRSYHLLTDRFIEPLFIENETKLLIFRRGPLVFAVNFHPTASYSDLRVPVPDPADYRVALDTDAAEFGGHGRAVPNITYPLRAEPWAGRPQSLLVYLPSRSAQVLCPVTAGVRQ